MMNPYLEEAVLVMLVVLSVPAFVYGFWRLTGRRLENKLIILLLYVGIFLIYFEINEMMFKHQPEELWLPKVVVETLGNQVNGE